MQVYSSSFTLDQNNPKSADMFGNNDFNLYLKKKDNLESIQNCFNLENSNNKLDENKTTLIFNSSEITNNVHKSTNLSGEASRSRNRANRSINFEKNEENPSAKLYYKTGKIRYQGEILNKKPCGIGVEYHDNQVVKYDGFWKDGHPHGEDC